MTTPQKPPSLYSREAEQSVLGGLFVSPISFDEVAATLKATDFADHVHRLIYQAMQALVTQNTPIDLVTIGDYLESVGQCPDPVPFAYLVSLARDTPSAANVRAYAQLVRNYAHRRYLISVADSLAGWARDLPDPAQTLKRLADAIAKIETDASEDGPRVLADLLPQVLADLDERAHRAESLLGLSTGLPDIDTLLDGLCPGRLYVFAGRPGTGKTVWGMQCARAAISAGQRVLFFTLEMPAHEIIHRLLAAEIPAHLGRLQAARLDPDEWQGLATTSQRLMPTQLWVDDSSELSITDLTSRARRLHRQMPINLLVVDYIGLMDGERSSNGYSNRTQEIGSITRALKQLAKELNIPIIALSQLNRSLEQRTDKRPILSDLRESGSIEQDSDVVAFLYRDELHNPDSPDRGCAEVIIRKNRSGPTGMIPLAFQGEHSRFMPLAGPLPSTQQPQPAAEAAPARRRPGFRRNQNPGDAA